MANKRNEPLHLNQTVDTGVGPSEENTLGNPSAIQLFPLIIRVKGELRRRHRFKLLPFFERWTSSSFDVDLTQGASQRCGPNCFIKVTEHESTWDIEATICGVKVILKTLTKDDVGRTLRFSLVSIANVQFYGQIFVESIP